MKLVSLTILLLFTFCSTAPTPKISLPDRSWAGPPDNLDKKPYEYYYTKHVAAAKPDTIKQKDILKK